MDGQGKHTGRIVPPQLTSGCFRDAVIERGPDSYGVSPTTGNAWNRAFLEKVLPIRESDFRICADKYLFSLAPLFGYTKSIAEPLAYYRMHEKNNYFCSAFEDRIKVELLNFERSSTALAFYCQKLGISVNPDAWERHSWWHRVHQSIVEIATVIPEGYSFILVDEDQWASTPIVAGRHRVPFPEKEGQYWGPPPNDSAAIRELERLGPADARFIVVAWPAFWWLEHYAGLHRHLRSTCRCVLENDRLVVFDRRL
jgi:hypothetical protein